jgi:hypothetical protein
MDENDMKDWNEVTKQDAPQREDSLGHFSSASGLTYMGWLMVGTNPAALKCFFSSTSILSFSCRLGYQGLGTFRALSDDGGIRRGLGHFNGSITLIARQTISLSQASPLSKHKSDQTPLDSLQNFFFSKNSHAALNHYIVRMCFNVFINDLLSIKFLLTTNSLASPFARIFLTNTIKCKMKRSGRAPAVIMAILKCLKVNIGKKDEGKGINGQGILTTKVISENLDVIAIQEPNNFKITGGIIFKSKLTKKKSQPRFGSRMK